MHLHHVSRSVSLKETVRDLFQHHPSNPGVGILLLTGGVPPSAKFLTGRQRGEDEMTI